MVGAAHLWYADDGKRGKRREDEEGEGGDDPSDEL